MLLKKKAASKRLDWDANSSYEWFGWGFDKVLLVFCMISSWGYI